MTEHPSPIIPFPFHHPFPFPFSSWLHFSFVSEFYFCKKSFDLAAKLMEDWVIGDDDFSSYFNWVIVLAPSSISCTALAKLLRKSETSRDRIANNRSASMTSFSVAPSQLSLLAMGSSVCFCMSTWKKAPSQENGLNLTTNRYHQHHQQRKVQNQYQSHNVSHHWAAPSTHRPVC